MIDATGRRPPGPSPDGPAEQAPEQALDGGRGGHHRVVVVGCGFAGIAVAVRLRQRGIEDFVVYERGSDVGGTWSCNTYPGCQCDVPSHLYSLSFAPNPDWTRTYSLQPEIKAYLRRTAERQGILGHVRLSTPVTDARWDEGGQRWRITTPSGTVTADVLVMANGPLSEPKLPAAAGLDCFKGATFHSGAWDHDHDLTGERVAVVGTGASAIQFVPRIAEQAAKVTIFQRTPPWVLPHRDRPIRPLERALYRRVPAAQKIARAFCYLSREPLIFAFAKRPASMEKVAEMGRKHLAAQVADPELRRRLTPSYMPGCKRLLPSNAWYPAVTRPNVEIVSAGVTELREHSVVASDGSEHEVDTVIFATGFHATDNPVMRIVHGRDGRSLAEVWAESGMSAYKGTTVAGFPNLFILAGPNTGVGHTSLVVMIEAQIRYLMGALSVLGEDAVLEVRPEVADAFNAEVQRAMAPTVWNVGGCASWYQDSAGRNPTIWPDFTFRFGWITRRFDPVAYRFEPRRHLRLVASVPPGGDSPPT